jgi:hypothetical protein
MKNGETSSARVEKKKKKKKKEENEERREMERFLKNRKKNKIKLGR